MVVDRKSKLRLRRTLRKRRRQVEDLGYATEDSLDKHLFRRLTKLLGIRRFLAGWISLLILLSIGVVLQAKSLSTYYQKPVPASGGTYREGIVGTFTNANPLYAQNSVDASVARLVFSGLLRYDEKGRLEPDLAESYEHDETETLYTVHLKQNVRWHDGELFNARDVVFTYNRIQNPEVKSPLLPSWRGVIIEATREHPSESNAGKQFQQRAADWYRAIPLSGSRGGCWR
jgi:ABC-type transport system substrate-binding protein